MVGQEGGGGGVGWGVGLTIGGRGMLKVSKKRRWLKMDIIYLRKIQKGG